MSIQRFEPLGQRLSHVSVYNGVVYLTGQVASDCKQDIKGQTRQILTRIDELLAKAGSDKSKILIAQIFLRDGARDFAGMNSVWEEWVSKDSLPSRATLEGRFTGDDILVEIIVQAAA